MSDKQRAKARQASRRRQRMRRRRENAIIRVTAVMISLMVVAAVVIITAPKRGGTMLFGRGQTQREVEIAGPVITLEPEPEETEAAESAATEAPAAESAAASVTTSMTAGEALDDSAARTAEAILQTELAPSQGFEYLPVYKKADIIDKKIAITVDDCFQVSNLQNIIRTAKDAGGKLTLFPIGENLSKAGMKETLEVALKLGYEIENHTWSHARIFRLPELEMAEEIWRQSAALNQLLGVNYEQHFLRLMGGDGSSDQRTHNYLKQLGYKGIAEWSVSGSDSTLEAIKKQLSPGQIYLFHTTDGDTQKLGQFIPYAVSQGYELVTMNELLGFEDNEISQYREPSMPVPQAYTDEYRVHKVGDYAWNIVRMQDKLRELGFLQMEGESTGYYGEKTAQAILEYQKSVGFSATGIADSETQERLLAS